MIRKVAGPMIEASDSREPGSVDATPAPLPPASPRSPERQLWPDLIRATATVLVVALHAFGHWLYSLGSISDTAWIAFNWADSASRVSVPLFFMLSGALLLGRPKSPGFLWRRALRIVPPLLFFSVFAFLFTKTLDHANYVPPRHWLVTPAYYHLWFFYKIAALYPIYFLLNPAKIDARAGLVISFVAILLFGGGIEQWAISPSSGHELTFAYLLYGFGGYFAIRCRFSRRDALVCGGVFAGCVAWIAIGTTLRSFAAHGLDETYYGYITVPVVTAAFAAFVGLKVLGDRLSSAPAGKITAGVRLISRYSIGIYGFHAFILQACFLLVAATGSVRYSTAIGVLIYVFVLTTSLLASYLVGKIDRGWILGRS